LRLNGVSARTRIWLVIILAGAVAALVLGSSYVPALRARSRAKKFLSDLASLRIGHSSFVDAARLASRYGGKPWPAFPQCTREDCDFYVAFDGLRNPVLIKSEVRLSALIHVRNGKIYAVEVTYECDASSGGRALYDVRDTSSDRSAPQNQMYRWESPGYGVAGLQVDEHAVPWEVFILLAKDATPQQRHLAFDIDLSCLAKVCKCEPSAVVPNAILSSLEARMSAPQSGLPHGK
jgi:hypothetical protein